jgi:hypothetical protein
MTADGGAEIAVIDRKGYQVGATLCGGNMSHPEFEDDKQRISEDRLR